MTAYTNLIRKRAQILDASFVYQVSPGVGWVTRRDACVFRTGINARKGNGPYFTRISAVATDPLQAGPYLKCAILGFNEQTERIVELAAVLIVGAMHAFISVPDAAYWRRLTACGYGVVSGG